MKQSALVLAILATLALTGCATPTETRSPTEVDKAYVGAVESKARRMGVDVQWVNPPRRARQAETQEEG